MAYDPINYGNADNDGTGTKNRVCWEKADTMFAELYSLIFSVSPVVGSKYPAFRNAVVHFLVNQQNTSDLYYISRIVVATALGGGLYNYIVDINRTNGVTAAGTKVLTYNFTFNHIVADPLRIDFGAVVAEYISGEMVIDFSKLTTGETYTCANWLEGGIMNPASSKPFGNGTLDGDGDPAYLPVFTGNFTADGAQQVYFGNSADPITCTIDTMANVKGSFMVKNKGIGVLTIVSAESLQIDGSPALQLAQGQSCEILPNVDAFEAVGEYTCVPLEGGLKMQQFTATEGQTTFTVTVVTLSDAAQVFLDENLQDGNYTRTGQQIIFSGGLAAGQRVKIYN